MTTPTTPTPQRDDDVKCELCGKPTDEDNFSSYYDDVLACKICVPDGFRDPDTEDERDEETPDEIALFRCESTGELLWSEDTSLALAVYKKSWPAEEQHDDAAECRAAFEKKYDKMYPSDKFSEERACAWTWWKAAWNTRADQSPPLPDEVQEAVKTVRHFIAITSDSLTNHAEIQAIETLIRAATQQPEVDELPEWLKTLDYQRDLAAVWMVAKNSKDYDETIGDRIERVLTLILELKKQAARNGIKIVEG